MTNRIITVAHPVSYTHLFVGVVVAPYRISLKWTFWEFGSSGFKPRTIRCSTSGVAFMRFTYYKVRVFFDNWTFPVYINDF